MPSNYISIIDRHHFLVQGRHFYWPSSDHQSQKTTRDKIIILKPPEFLRLYDAVFQSAPNKRVIEVGFFEAGSLIYLALAFPEFSFVGVDKRPKNDQIEDVIRDLGLERRIKLYYEQSQDNEVALREIIKTEFQDEPLGIVVDDASHQYALSRRTLEILFPRLAPGGLYALEDWAWAHWPEPYQTQLWRDNPALTNLVFEMIATLGTNPAICQKITATRSMTLFERGPSVPHEFDLDAARLIRGKQFTLI